VTTHVCVCVFVCVCLCVCVCVCMNMYMYIYTVVTTHYTQDGTLVTTHCTQGNSRKAGREGKGASERVREKRREGRGGVVERGEGFLPVRGEMLASVLGQRAGPVSDSLSFSFSLSGSAHLSHSLTHSLFLPPSLPLSLSLSLSLPLSLPLSLFLCFSVSLSPRSPEQLASCRARIPPLGTISLPYPIGAESTGMEIRPIIDVFKQAALMQEHDLHCNTSQHGRRGASIDGEEK
jgi:hypothetical protein